MAQYIKTEDGYKEFSIVTDDKMDKTNPTGTGSFSMNRKAGTVIGTNSHAEGNDTTASRAYSHAEGDSTQASGIVSHAEGFYTKASGDYSHAEGYWATASGSNSHAEGFFTTTSGKHSHAEGNHTTASGIDSHAEGGSTNAFSSVVTTTNPTTADIIKAWETKKFSVAKGNYSHVEGKDNLALNDYSHAEGSWTTASNSYSHAEGYSTKASGGSSHAEGYITTARGSNSHAEGYRTTASGGYSHAEGYRAKASGGSSHAEGQETTASGGSSHAEGVSTKASGIISHAEGYLTTASGDYSHVQGKFNIEDTSDTYADIIGNGTSNTARSNAATVDWTGNAWYAGNVYTGSTSGTNKDDGSKKLATEEYVNSSIAASSIQSDWNQNDKTKKDYIKGRTHWTEIKPVVEKVNIITDASYKYESQGCYKINGAVGCTYPQNIELTEGTPITITIETESFTGQLSASTDTNLLEFSLKDQQVNGYKVPSAWYFFLEEHKLETWGEGSGGSPAMSFSITAEIEQEREVVHTLDPKYIKDMYYTETNLKELLCEFTTDGSSSSRITMPERLEPDTVYIWTFNEETGKSLCKRSVSGVYVTAYIQIADYGIITEQFSTTTPDNYTTAYNPDTSQLPGHITISKEKPDVVHQIDPKYIPNQSIVFEARLFPDSSIPNKLNLESGIVVGDLVNAFDEGKRVIARLCFDENDDGIPFEMQMYYVDSSSGIPYKIMFAPCSRSLVESSGAIDSINTMVIGFIEGNWYFSGFNLGSVGGPVAPYTVPFEVDATCCDTFAELVSATQDFRWRAYIYVRNHKLYLQVPEYSSSVTPNILYFTGITEPDGSGISSCVWTTIRIPVSPSNVILWDDSTLPTSNTALDTWDYYKLNKDQSGALRVYDVFNEKITNLGLVGKGVIEYGDYRYLFNCIAGYSFLFYCMDFTNSSVPKISTISINRRTNTIGVTNFHPIWEVATESEVNNAVDNIFKTI